MKSNQRVAGSVKRPAISPGLLGYIMKIFQNITIEPAYFLISFASGIDDVSASQMLIYKTCRADFGFNETVCDDENLLTIYKDENEMIQNEVAQFNVYRMLVGTIFPVFFAFYLGAWCDLFGRKLLFKLYLTARCLDQVVVILCAYFLESKKEYLLLASIPTALAGGFGAWMLAINAFVADITSSEYLAFRYGMIHLAGSLARPIAPIFGAYLLKTGGYVCVFTTSLAGTLLGSLLLLVMIRSYEWNPEKKATDRSAFSLQHPIDCFRTTFKKREGPNRKYILMFIAIISLTVMPFAGEGSVAYNYVRTRYEWGYQEYSEYSSIVSACSIIGKFDESQNLFQNMIFKTY